MVINSTGKPPHVLAFEAWDSGSHRAVREAIEESAHFDWHWQTLGIANWRW